MELYLCIESLRWSFFNDYQKKSKTHAISCARIFFSPVTDEWGSYRNCKNQRSNQFSHSFDLIAIFPSNRQIRIIRLWSKILSILDTAFVESEIFESKSRIISSIWKPPSIILISDIRTVSGLHRYCIIRKNRISTSRAGDQNERKLVLNLDKISGLKLQRKKFS